MGIPPRWMRITLTVVILTILLGIAWYYQIQRQRLLQNVQADLTIPLQQQIDTIKEWRSIRLDEASVALIGQYTSPLLSRWMQNPPSQMETDSLVSTLRATQLQYLYTDVLFVNPAGKLYFRMNAQAGDLSERSRQSAVEAL